MCPIPNLPEFASVCRVNETGETVASDSETDNYRNLFIESLANLADETPQQEIDPLMHCPITSDFMVNPVITPDGTTYERAAILAWLRSNARDPMSRNPLQSHQLRPNNLAQTITFQQTNIDPESEAAYELINNDDQVGHNRRDLNDVIESFENSLMLIGNQMLKADNAQTALADQALAACSDGDTVQGAGLSTGSIGATLLQPIIQPLGIFASTAVSATSSADATTVSSSHATVNSTASSAHDNQPTQPQTAAGDNNGTYNNTGNRTNAAGKD